MNTNAKATCETANSQMGGLPRFCHVADSTSGKHRVPIRPGKPRKMKVHLENLEISWKFEKFNKNH